MEKIIIGIDEAGRGPLAGPVAVGAFAIKSKEVLKYFKGVKDSKQLSAKQREVWFGEIKRLRALNKIGFAVSFSSEVVIDRQGISKAVALSIARCLKKLTKQGFCVPRSEIKLDGLLKAPIKYKNQRTIIGGDESEPLIALASICAKVLRDRKMGSLAKKYPHYGLEIHKGYGTKKHYAAISKYGVAEFHRKSYLKNK